MIRIQKLGENDWRPRWMAWQWMRQQPKLYADEVGYDDLVRFCEPGYEAHQDYEISVDNQQIGLLTCIHRAPGVCEIGLITAPKTPARPLLRALAHLQRGYFEQYGHTLFMTTKNPQVSRLVQLLGWQDRGDYMEITK